MIERSPRFAPRPPIVGGASGASPAASLPARVGGRFLALLLALLCTALLAGPVGAASGSAADTLDDRVREIAKELRCPVCAGETVADSNAPLSVQMRGSIREKLEAGESREQILQSFVDSYGESILAEPPARGFALGVWVAPLVALAVGLGVVLAVLRGWRRRVGDAVPPAAAAAAVSPEEERLERELARFRRPARPERTPRPALGDPERSRTGAGVAEGRRGAAR